jgi:hypothetical protein
MFVNLNLTNSQETINSLERLIRKYIYLRTQGFKVNRTTLSKIAEIVSVSIVGNSQTNTNNFQICQNTHFSVSSTSGKCRKVGQKKIVPGHQNHFTLKAIRPNTYRAEVEKHLKEKEERKYEKQLLKQEKKELQERAERNGLLGINVEAEEKIPHMIPSSEEYVHVEQRTINHYNIFYMVLLTLGNVIVATKWKWTLPYNVAVFCIYGLITLVTSMIARRRSTSFRKNFERLTGWSVEKLEDAREARVDIKVLKQMKVLVDDQQELTEGTFVQYWSLIKYEYELINVLKNNVRSKYVESFITEETLRQVKAERKAQYEEQLANVRRGYLRCFVSFVWNSFVFVLDHKALVAALIFGGTITSFFGVLRTALAISNIASSTLSTAATLTTSSVNAAVKATEKVKEATLTTSRLFGSAWKTLSSALG